MERIQHDKARVSMLQLQGNKLPSIKVQETKERTGILLRVWRDGTNKRNAQRISRKVREDLPRQRSLPMSCKQTISTHNKILLSVDNHETHVSLDVINFCREHGIIMLSFPPHSTHKVQPLDVGICDPFKVKLTTAFNDFITTGARVGVGKGSPVVVWLGPPRIAAWVIVLAGGQGAGSSLAAGGSPFLDSSSTTVEDEDEG
ncbi:hypothetical protein GEV33_008196 [Tenebrio molitor]|uniref:DDE-1 domain-containing protein n=1 Tax=Tenebrio molitor TaxID=7067 RepID=A0A8J6LB27_TENMO|nr:hypothetical protein GEV33_008196 [Tenebrio molitor]